MTATNILKLTQANFAEQVLGVPGPVVVDFLARMVRSLQNDGPPPR